MKIWAAVSDAMAGWMLILGGETGWRERFALTWPGLATSVVIFLCCAFLAIAMASTAQGMPGISGIIDALLAQASWIVAVLISVRLTAAILKSNTPVIDMLVPATYLLVGYLLVGAMLNLVAPMALLVLTASLGYPFYRLGRVVADWPAANALVFAVLTLVLLVGIPLAFYMLSNPAI